MTRQGLGGLMISAEMRNWQVGLERILDAPAERDTLQLIQEVCDFAAEIGHDNGDALLDACPQLLQYRPSFVDEFRHNVVGREIAEADRLLAADIAAPISFRAVAAPHSVGMYDRLADVIADVDFSTCRRVVMVGCGWRPITIFSLHDQTSVPEIIGLDIVPEAVRSATALAAKLGYGRMRAELCDGRIYDYAGVQRVYIASMVTAKSAVISRILNTAPDDVRIILWEPYSLGRLWMESAERQLDPRLEVTGRGTVSRLARDVFIKRRAEPVSAPATRS